MAPLSRASGADVVTAIPGFADEQKRVLAATVDGLRVICVYVPNGESAESHKYGYKLSWLEALRAWLAQEVQAHPRLALVGDYNIAPEDRDVHDPTGGTGSVLAPGSARSIGLLS